MSDLSPEPIPPELQREIDRMLVSLVADMNRGTKFAATPMPRMQATGIQFKKKGDHIQVIIAAKPKTI